MTSKPRERDDMRRPSLSTPALILGVAVCLAACGGGDDTTATTGADETISSTQPATTPVPPANDTTTGDARNETVETAQADLAERLAVDAAEIEVVSYEEVTWDSGALGCPEPGQMYTQALVEGSLTILAVDGTEYRYHAGRDGDPFLCENPALDTRDGGPGTTEGPPES